MNRPAGPEPVPFTSRMTRREIAAVLAYLPLHIGLLPLLLLSLPQTAGMSEIQINFAIYAIGALWMLLFAGRFLRRDFDPLCEHPFYCLLQVVTSYGMVLALNMLLSALLMLVQTELSNPNNAAWSDMVTKDFGKTAASAVFLAPLVEEPIFRGAVFSLFRPKDTDAPAVPRRRLAYLTSMLLFSLYHVWGYAIQDPANWLYLLQYLPASWVLCRCYERSHEHQRHLGPHDFRPAGHDVILFSDPMQTADCHCGGPRFLFIREAQSCPAAGAVRRRRGALPARCRASSRIPSGRRGRSSNNSGSRTENRSR